MRTGRISINGRSGRGRLTIGSTAPAPAGGPKNFSVAGDSIWNDQGAGAPANLLVPALSTAMPGDTFTFGINRAHNGYSTSYALTVGDSTDVDADVAAIAAVSTSAERWVVLNYGINNTRDTLTTTKAVYLSEYATIIAKYRAAGIKVIVQAPTYASFSGDSRLLLESFLPDLPSLCNGSTVVMGDRGEAYVSGVNHPNWLLDGVHPNSQGITAYVNSWVAGIKDSLTPYTGVVDVFPGGIFSATAFLNKFANWSPKAFADRWGLNSLTAFGSTTPAALYTQGANFNNTAYDLLGYGAEVRINPSIGGGSTSTVPVTVQGAIAPYQWGPPHPSFEPGPSYTWRYGLPSNATDINDPDNDPVNHPGAVQTKAEWLAYHRQQWMEIGNGYWGVVGDADFWSDYLTVATVPLNSTDHVGVETYGGFASYSRCFATSPRRNDSGQSGSDWLTQFAAVYLRDNPLGATLDRDGNPAHRIIAMARSRFVNCQEVVTIDNKGLLANVKGPTTRDNGAYPLPTYLFASYEEPVDVSVSSMSEYTAVLVHDHNTHGSKVVIFANQGYGLVGHNMPYVGLGNEGCFTRFQRIGEKALVMKDGTKVIIATDAALPPTPELVGDVLADSSTRASVRRSNIFEPYNDNPALFCAFARQGYFAVISKDEGKLEIYNFSAYIENLFQRYTEPDQTTWNATISAMNAGTFPMTFSGTASGVRTDLAPVLMHSEDISRPTCMYASGNVSPDRFQGDGWGDYEKLLVGTESGNVESFNMASVMDRFKSQPFQTDTFRNNTFWQYGPEVFRGNFQVGTTGSNITEIINSRYQQDSSYALVASTGVMRSTGSYSAGENPNSYQNSLHFCCSADATVYSVCTRYDLSANGGAGAVLAGAYRTIRDPRIKKPVAIGLCTRSMIMEIADWDACGIHAVQIGAVGRNPVIDTSNGNAVVAPGLNYEADPTNTNPWGYAGFAPTCGHPFHVSGDNIN